MKVHVIMRVRTMEEWKAGNASNPKVVYCGYLEFDEMPKEEIWHWCNWDCWSYKDDEDECVRPKECEHLTIGHCNSDMSYCIDGVWYSHAEYRFASLHDCYAEMSSKVHYTKHFSALWPIHTGMQIVNEDELKEIVNK